ncbi:MAG: phosphoribosylformylglycinamidine synthase subunit [Rubrobacteraceae bacterium]|nr:phosphoribosylformylglycinamidine synthase subunit [Rubrobacteraceae bacterium]
MRIGVTVFPGSNCDRDALYGVERMGAEAVELWHADADLKGVDAVIVPGGFSYGDYLRPGAIARFANVMGPLEEFAKGGGPVLGVCNGFQVLTEAHLLPGALLRNTHMRFVCDRVRVRVESVYTPWTANPNGSANDIAGVCNEDRNVVGIMPHPERVSDPALGSDEGLRILRSVLVGAGV